MFCIGFPSIGDRPPRALVDCHCMPAGSITSHAGLSLMASLGCALRGGRHKHESNLNQNLPAGGAATSVSGGYASRHGRARAAGTAEQAPGGEHVASSRAQSPRPCSQCLTAARRQAPALMLPFRVSAAAAVPAMPRSQAVFPTLSVFIRRMHTAGTSAGCRRCRSRGREALSRQRRKQQTRRSPRAARPRASLLAPLCTLLRTAPWLRHIRSSSSGQISRRAGTQGRRASSTSHGSC